MLFAFSTGRGIAERFAPLVDASMEIKVEATTAHLFLEELIAGDESVDINTVWQHIDSAIWYANAMLKGGNNVEGIFLPLKNKIMREKIEQTLINLNKFKEIGKIRFQQQSTSGVSSDIENKFDNIFDEFIISTDSVETELQLLIESELENFYYLRFLLLSIIIMLGIIITSLLMWHERRHLSDLQNLNDEKENLRITLRSIGDAVIATDNLGNITAMNPVAEQLTGWKEADVVRTNLSEIFNIVNAETRDRVNNPVKKVLKNGEIVGLANHTILIDKNGKEYQIADSAAPIYDIHGEIKGVVLVFRDVSEEYKIQEELRKNELKYRLLADYTHDWEYWISKDKEYIYVSPSCKRISGYSADDFYKDPKLLYSIVEDDYKKDVRKHYEDENNLQNEAVKLEFPIITRNGEKKWIEHNCYPVYDQEGNSVGRRGNNRDITDKKLADDSLLKFKLGIEHSADAIFITEVDGTITYVNPYFCNIYGYSPSDVVGKTPRILKSDNFSEDIYADFWNKLLKKQSVNWEIVNKTKSGELIFVESSNNPIIDECNNLVGFIAIHRDITKRKEDEKELIGAKKRAENADKMKSIFLAQMSHEIRTPINALVSMASLLRYDFEDDANQDQIVSFYIIDRAGERIIRTVDLLLNLSEIQAGTYEINNSKLDIVSDVISVIVAEHRIIAKKKNININAKMSITNTELVADPYTINQIFTQILDNAIKYTEEGKIEINTFRDSNKNLIVEISDTGIGIDPEYLPYIFKPFSQEEMGYTRKFEGNGIGMALVKKYCELNNAKIEIESEKGVGSTFRIIFN